LSPPHHQPLAPLVYLITNRRAFPRKSELFPDEPWRLQIEAIRLAAAAGCNLIQIREKDLGARALTEFTREVIDAAHPHGARVLVNDRLDVAMAAGADGVHLRVTSLSAAEVRETMNRQKREDFLIGVSTHSLAEALEAQNGGADFIVCGPVYDTPSKREYGPPLGLDRFAQICQKVAIPVLALGGISLANFREPLQHGAAGIAAIGLFGDPEQLQTTISTILNAR
jgi:thiamine-phosphate pyrophosphorylase